MDLGKPAAGGPNKIKEMQDKLRTKNIETLESVAET